MISGAGTDSGMAMIVSCAGLTLVFGASVAISPHFADARRRVVRARVRVKDYGDDPTRERGAPGPARSASVSRWGRFRTPLVFAFGRHALMRRPPTIWRNVTTMRASSSDRAPTRAGGRRIR